MKWLRWLIVASVLGVAAIGLVWVSNYHGAANAQSASSVHIEDLIAAKAGVSVDSIHKVEAAALSVVGDKGSAAGVLSSDQASKVRALQVGPIGDRVLQGLATTLNMSETDVFNGLVGGQSLSQLATAHNVDAATLKTGLTNTVQSELNTAAGNGLITPAQSTMIMSAFTANVDQIVNLSASHADHMHTKTTTTTKTP